MNLMDYLSSAKYSLFRFESLQEYKVDGDDMSDEGMKEWWNFIAAKTKDGVLMQRVRLVVHPLNEYTKKELEVHKKSIKFGDDIRTIDEDVYNQLAIGVPDFWLINDKIVLKMKYSPKGEYEGFEVLEKDAHTYVAIKKLLLEHSLTL